MSTNTAPTKLQREALEAIACLEKGSWEIIDPHDADECVRNGWVEVSEGLRYRLTEAGREVLRRDNPDAATSSAVTQERA